MSLNRSSTYFREIFEICGLQILEESIQPELENLEPITLWVLKPKNKQTVIEEDIQPIYSVDDLLLKDDTIFANLKQFTGTESEDIFERTDTRLETMKHETIVSEKITLQHQ
jgi:hypothetical protein